MTEVQKAAIDELDDGLEYDVDFSDSQDGQDFHDAGVSDDSDNDTQVPANDDDDKDDDKDSQPANTTEKSTGGKKRKAGENKLKEKKRLKMELDLEKKKDISKEQSPEIIADYINQIVAQKNKKLSSLELSELYVSKNDIRSTQEIEGPRNLDGVSKYINSRFKNMLPSGGKKSNKDKKSTGTESVDERKFISIISMSAIRACDVHRATRNLPGSSLKLINKNKIDVDLKLLKTTKSRVLCCTPGRLKKVLLHEDRVLGKDEVKIILLDNSYLDQKGQNIWDIPETIQVIKDLTSNGAKVYLY